MIELRSGQVLRGSVRAPQSMRAVLEEMTYLDVFGTVRLL
jgi:hypothetical protein